MFLRCELLFLEAVIFLMVFHAVICELMIEEFPFSGNCTQKELLPKPCLKEDIETQHCCDTSCRALYRHCPPGHGSKMKKPKDKPKCTVRKGPKCKACDHGKQWNSGTSLFCHKCTDCKLKGQEVTRPCNATSDAVCGKCLQGYVELSSQKCIKCSGQHLRGRRDESSVRKLKKLCKEAKQIKKVNKGEINEEVDEDTKLLSVSGLATEKAQDMSILMLTMILVSCGVIVLLAIISIFLVRRSLHKKMHCVQESAKQKEDKGIDASIVGTDDFAGCINNIYEDSAKSSPSLPRAEIFSSPDPGQDKCIAYVNDQGVKQPLLSKDSLDENASQTSAQVEDCKIDEEEMDVSKDTYNELVEKLDQWHLAFDKSKTISEPKTNYKRCNYKTERFCAGQFSREGGYLRIEEYNVGLFIPPDALVFDNNSQYRYQEVYIYIDNNLVGENGKLPVSPNIRCGPHGLEFKVPVILTYPSVDADGDIETVFVSSNTVLSEDPDWKKTDDCYVVKKGTQRKAFLTHFTNYRDVASGNGHDKILKAAIFGPLQFGRNHKLYKFKVCIWENTNNEHDKTVKKDIREEYNHEVKLMEQPQGGLTYLQGHGGLVVEVNFSLQDINGQWENKDSREKVIAEDAIWNPHGQLVEPLISDFDLKMPQENKYQCIRIHTKIHQPANGTSIILDSIHEINEVQGAGAPLQYPVEVEDGRSNPATERVELMFPREIHDLLCDKLDQPREDGKNHIMLARYLHIPQHHRDNIAGLPGNHGPTAIILYYLGSEPAQEKHREILEHFRSVLIVMERFDCVEILNKHPLLEYEIVPNEQADSVIED